MRVCAHITFGPFNSGHKRFGSIRSAVDYFRSEVVGVDYGTGLGSIESGDEQLMDLYPQCGDCRDGECYHNYPMTRYSAGPRGGLTRQTA